MRTAWLESWRVGRRAASKWPSQGDCSSTNAAGGWQMGGTWWHLVTLGDTWWQMGKGHFGLVFPMILAISGAFGGRWSAKPARRGGWAAGWPASYWGERDVVDKVQAGWKPDAYGQGKKELLQKQEANGRAVGGWRFAADSRPAL